MYAFSSVPCVHFPISHHYTAELSLMFGKFQHSDLASIHNFPSDQVHCIWNIADPQFFTKWYLNKWPCHCQGPCLRPVPWQDFKFLGSEQFISKKPQQGFDQTFQFLSQGNCISHLCFFNVVFSVDFYFFLCGYQWNKASHLISLENTEIPFLYILGP